jgi:hypothetical protein
MSLALADFNGDGQLDVASCNQSAATVSLLFGGAGGTLTPASSLTVCTAPLWIASGDFDLDGAVDLAVACGQMGTRLYSGLGNGAFKAGVNLSLGSDVRYVLAADFNRDGILDIAGTNYYDHVTFVLGLGDGTFSMLKQFVASDGPVCASTTDCNGDGRLDLLVGNDYATDVVVYQNATP